MYIQFRTFALPRPSPPAPPPNLPCLQFLITCSVQKQRGNVCGYFTHSLWQPLGATRCVAWICLVHMMLFSVDARLIFKAGTEHYAQKVWWSVSRGKPQVFNLLFVYCKQPQIYLHCTTLWKTSWFSYPTHTSKLYIKTNVCVLQTQTHAQHYLYCMPVSACTRPSLTWWCCRRIHWQHGFLCIVDMRFLVCDHVRCGQTH